MGEHIRKSAAVEALKAKAEEIRKRKKFGDRVIAKALETYGVECVDNVPVSDEACVAHGKWIPAPDQYGFVICNVCKSEISKHWDGPEKWPYCNCGAKMDQR